MTMRGFGNVMPIHIAVLQLAGYVVDYRSKRIRAAVGDRERKRTMREGLAELRESTGQDFGYDLAAWRERLMADEESGYTHPYAFESVDAAILEAITDRRRQETAEQTKRRWRKRRIAGIRSRGTFSAAGFHARTSRHRRQSSAWASGPQG